MKRTFFFDSHPPLGKQLVSAAAYLAGFDGQFKFDRIGSPYSDAIPLYALRLVPAICGSLLIPTGYYLVLELSLKQWAAAIAGILLLLGSLPSRIRTFMRILRKITRLRYAVYARTSHV